MLVIIWHLLTNRAARYRDLGVDYYYISRLDTTHRARSHARQSDRRSGRR
jgi:hypothetical protein